jgi:hypothetical protein
MNPLPAAAACWLLLLAGCCDLAQLLVKGQHIHTHTHTHSHTHTHTHSLTCVVLSWPGSTLCPVQTVKWPTVAALRVKGLGHVAA